MSLKKLVVSESRIAELNQKYGILMPETLAMYGDLLGYEETWIMLDIIDRNAMEMNRKLDLILSQLEQP